MKPTLADTARELLKEARSAALATLGEDGAPFATLVAIAPDANNGPVMLVSKLAVHTANLQRDARASLLITRAAMVENPLENPRLSLVGRVEPIEKNPATRESFLSHHPAASAYLDFADFVFFRFRIEAAHLVAGFGRAGSISPSELASIERGN